MKKKDIEPCRQQIADAISWSLIHQLMRRYQAALGLRIYELHPGGGQYDCISVRRYHNGRVGDGFFEFNLGAQSLHVFASKYERFDIVDHCLHAADPKKTLDLICRTADLDPKIVPPPSTGPVLATGVMAGLIQENAFSRRHLKWYMGAMDTSGYGGGVRQALANFQVTKSLVENDKPAKAYRYFYLSKAEDYDNPMCLIDMAGKMIFRDDSEMELLPAYSACGRKINLLTHEVAKRLG